MKNYRKTVAALVLALAFSTSALAGEMHTGITQPDPQPTPTTNGVMHTDGEIQTGEIADTPTTTDAVTETALTLLQGLLALI